jgi:hypothetical protein
MDGFDHYGIKSDSVANISTALQAAGYTLRNFTNTTFALDDGRLAGSLAMKMVLSTTSGGVNPSFSATATTNQQKVVFGFALKTSGARSRIARIENLVDINWDATTGKLNIIAGSNTVVSTDIFILDAWYFFELVIDKTLNQIKLYANDTLEATVALPAGSYTSYVATWGQAEAATGSAVTQWIDDLYILDSSTSAANLIDRLSPIQVTTRFPTADVATAWNVVGQGGSPAHYTIAGRPATANPSVFLQTNVAGATDQFRSNAVLPDDNQVFAVALVSYAKKGDLDARQIGLQMNVDAATQEVQIPLTTSFAFQQAIFEQAPGAVAWNRNRVESTTFGIIAR